MLKRLRNLWRISGMDLEVVGNSNLIAAKEPTIPKRKQQLAIIVEDKDKLIDEIVNEN